jgi:hypothetical protein
MFEVKNARGVMLALTLVLASSGAAFAAQEHKHEHGASTAKLVLNQGKKWPTDEPLRKGMDNIRAAISAEKDYEALARKISGEIAYIVQNCKLGKDADEQLHIVLAELIEGVESIEGRHKGETLREGVERIVRALNDYGGHFDHKGWKPL